MPADVQSHAGRTGLAIAGFRLVRLLHESAVSAVWEAESDGRRYALKCALEGRSHEASRAWLAAEYRRGRSLAHPHIAMPLGWLDEDGQAAIVFEYLAGGDLAGLAGFPPRVWSRALLDLLDALRYLHGRGLVHCDVKARNAMLDDTDSVRLIDLGSSRPVGAPRRAAGMAPVADVPETGSAVTPKDDMYAIAALAAELLTGGRGRSGSAAPGDEALAAAIDAVLAAAPDAVEEKLSLLAHVLESRND